MIRYSVIKEKNPREIVLLKGFSCAYGKCAFCNYILDNTDDEEEMNRVNLEAINQITGEKGVLQVINSGSVFELNDFTLAKIKKVCREKNIKILYFEAYFGYINRLNEIRKYFSEQEVRFAIGMETFDNEFRTKVLTKNFITNDKVLEKIKKEYKMGLFMICIKGQTKEMILRDIELAKEYFDEIALSVFVNNDTKVERDEELVKWFLTEIYPELNKKKNIEILVDNKDFGVYVQ